MRTTVAAGSRTRKVRKKCKGTKPIRNRKRKKNPKGKRERK